MNSSGLRNICINRFGFDKGNKLVRLMFRIKKLDFCVATAWNEDEISISRSCSHIGKIFKVSKDYKRIIAPDNYEIELSRAKNLDIEKYLPKAIFSEGRKHCQSDY